MKQNKGKGLPRKLTMASMVGLALAAGWQSSAMGACTTISAGVSISSTVGCQIWTGGNVQINANGLIAAGGNTAMYINGVSGGTLTNNGTIASTYYGTWILPNSNLAAWINTGLVQGSYVATNQGRIGALTNSGTITGVVAVYNSGTITSLHNTGQISGSNIGIQNDSNGTIGSLINDGLISSPTAISNSSTGLLSTIQNNGTIAGGITNMAVAPLSIAGATGTTFGTLTGNSGGVGTITSTHGLAFAGGNLLLNDNINVGSSTVDSSSKIQVNRPINITGDYNQRAAATLVVGVADNATSAGVIGDTGYGRLAVSGNATVASGSSVVLTKTGSTYAFAAGQRYVVITAGGTGTYNEGSLHYGINDTSAGNFTLTGANVANNLVVTVENLPSGSDNGGGGSVASPGPVTANTLNANSALTGLRKYSGIATGLLDLYNASLAIGSSAQANAVGEQLTPTQNLHAASAASTATFDSMSVVSNHMNGLRVAQAGRSGVATGENTGSWGAWTQVFGGEAHQGMIDTVSGYKASYSGIVLGADRAFGDAWRAGGAFTHSQTSLNGADNLAGSSSHVDAYGLIAYASYNAQPWYLNLSTSAVRDNYSSTRLVSLTGFDGAAQASYNGWQYVAKVEAGYPMALPRNVTVTPLASLSYSRLNQNGYTETGSGAALAVQGSHENAVRSGLGARLEKSMQTKVGELTPYAQLLWSHQYNDSRMSSTASYAADSTGATSFITLDASPVKDMAELTLGVNLLKSDDLTLSARYDLQAGSHYDVQTFSVRLQKRF